MYSKFDNVKKFKQLDNGKAQPLYIFANFLWNSKHLGQIKIGTGSKFGKIAPKSSNNSITGAQPQYVCIIGNLRDLHSMPNYEIHCIYNELHKIKQNYQWNTTNITISQKTKNIISTFIDITDILSIWMHRDMLIPITNRFAMIIYTYKYILYLQNKF